MRTILSIRQIGRVKHPHRRNFFCFLNLRGFVLLRQDAINRLSNFRPAIQVCIGVTEQWQFSNAWKSQIGVRSLVGSIVCIDTAAGLIGQVRKPN